MRNGPQILQSLTTFAQVQITSFSPIPEDGKFVLVGSGLRPVEAIGRLYLKIRQVHHDGSVHIFLREAHRCVRSHGSEL